MAQPLFHYRLLRSGIGLLAWVVLAASWFAPPARGDGPHPKRKDQYKHEVEKLEEVWRVAQLNDDIAAMDKLLSNDYVGITMSGQVVTKMQQLDRMRNRSTVLTKITLDDVKVKVIGTTAIVQSLAQVDGTMDGAPMHGDYRYTRVYSRLPAGTWEITNFEATRVGMPRPPDGRHPRPASP
jgi:ketosteroid isomerase-like protein